MNYERVAQNPERALALLRRHFLCRSDVLAFMASWDKPCPTQEGTDLDALLAAHVCGEAAPKASVRYRNRYGTGAELGWFRVGTYTPALDGTTKWLCLDFDGGGHAEALADPKSTALAVRQAFTQAGIPAYLERSGGGKGWHLWCFFDPPVPAKLARALAFALLPNEVTLASGEIVQANSGRVIEVFPKQTKIEDDGYGNLVWLPWWWKADWPANQFHRLDDVGELVPYLPESFDTASTEAVEALIATSRAEAKEQRKQEKQQATERSWQEWRGRALGALPLDAVYGEWLTGKRHKTGWLECRDPWSSSGDRDPSAGVADGTGEAERGAFHSFISGKSLSVFDFLIERGLAADFRAAREKVAELSGVSLPEPKQRHAERDGPASALPSIVTNRRQLRTIVADAWSAVRSGNDPPRLFLRSGLLARVIGESDDSPAIEPMQESAVTGLLARVADWVRMTDEGPVAVMPLREVAADMLAYPAPDLPRLESITTTPVFSAEGTLLLQPGYHAADRLWHDPRVRVDPAAIPARPTAADIAAARALLDEPFCDFPLKTEADRAHVLAALLLPFVRRMIHGCTPVHLVQAPTEGTGKGLLCKLIAIVVAGNEGNTATLSPDEDEARKLLTAQLALGQPIVLLDNAKRGRMLDCPALASIITTQIWKDRLLGQSRMLSLPNQALWLITGNNPVLSMELARRCIRIHMDAGVERAWGRQEFRHMPVTGWAMEHRTELVQAALVLGQAWIAAGKPLHPVRLGSFEQWSEVMGGILQVAGVPGFLGNLDDLYESADAEGQMWREFVAQWWESFGLQPKRPADLLELCEQHDLMLKVRGDGSPRSQQTKLGTALHGARDRVFCDLRVTQYPDPRARGRLYALVPVRSGSQPTALAAAEPAEPLPNLDPEGSATERLGISSLFAGDAEPAEPLSVPHARERGDDMTGDTRDSRAHARGAEEGSEGTAGSEMQEKPSFSRAEPSPNLAEGSAYDSPVDLANLPEETEE